VNENPPNPEARHNADPDRKRYQLLLDEVLPEQVPAEDRDLLLAFDSHLVAMQRSLGRRSNYLTHLVRIRDLLGKPFKEATKEDIERVLTLLPNSGKGPSRRIKNSPLSARTILGYKISIKRFYKWLLGNDEDYPSVVKWIKTSRPNGRALPRDSLLTDEEIEKLIRACDCDRDRAIVLILAESGIRAGELLSLRIQDIRFDKNGALINVRGKTGDRTVRLVASAPALATWLEHHPQPDDPNAPLWVDMKTKYYGMAMTYEGLRAAILRIKARAKIKKRVHLQGLRHSAATRLARLLTDAEMKQYFGWTQGSNMASVYIHLSSKDVDRSFLRVHGLITEEEDKGLKFATITCSRCKHVNNPGTRTCEKCGLPLTVKAAREIDKRRELLDLVTAKLKKSPKFKDFEEALDALIEEALTK
jgi:integrase/recombinase XerD